MVTRNGRARVVLISADEYERLTATRSDFKEFLINGESFDGLDLERDQSPVRDVAL